MKKAIKSLSDFFHNKIITIPDKPQGVITYLRETNILSRAIYDRIHTEEKITLSKKQQEYMEQFFELYKLSKILQTTRLEILSY